VYFYGLPWGPSILLYNGYRVSFPGAKRPSSAEVKERVQATPLPPPPKSIWTFMDCPTVNFIFNFYSTSIKYKRDCGPHNTSWRAPGWRPMVYNTMDFEPLITVSSWTSHLETWTKNESYWPAEILFWSFLKQTTNQRTPKLPQKGRSIRMVRFSTAVFLHLNSKYFLLPAPRHNRYARPWP
jgi:hypothetical protein